METMGYGVQACRPCLLDASNKGVKVDFKALMAWCKARRTNKEAWRSSNYYSSTLTFVRKGPCENWVSAKSMDIVPTLICDASR